MAALAAGLALLALPASAQDRGHGRWGGDGAAQGNGGGNGGGWRGGNSGGGRGLRGEQSTPAPTPAPAPQVQAQQPPQRNWSRGNGNGWNRGNGGDGDRGRFVRGRGADVVATQQPPATPAPQVTERRNWQGNGGGARWQGRNWRGDGGAAQWQGRNWQGNGANQWQGRNRSYVDPNRNGTYRDPNRDNARSGGTVSRWHYDGNGWRNNDSWRGGHQAYGGSRSWSRDWRGDSRYDWRGYRDAHRGVYRLGPYYAPYRGYSYQRLGVGFYLDGLFFGSNYWIDDPWSYRLPPADGPYRWIRYYDDALLVDTYSGEVVDVIYDFFW